MRSRIRLTSLIISPVLVMLLIANVASSLDTDSDGIADSLDNCRNASNQNQTDTDQDGFGNYCDGDLDQDTYVLGTDYTMFLSCFGQYPSNPGCKIADLNDDGSVSGADYTIILALIGDPVGPSGLACADPQIKTGNGDIPCISGVEQRALELSAVGATICSEPMNGPETGASGLFNSNPASSTGSLQCWNSRSGFIGPDFEGSGNAVHAVTGWGSTEYAITHTNPFMWWWGWDPTAIDSSIKGINYRYYIQIESDFGSTGGYAGLCPGSTWRNKLFQMSLWGQNMQLEEGQGSESCTTSDNYPLYISIDDGPGSTTDWGGGYGQAPFSPSVTLRSCVSAPCMIEMAVEGNLSAGTSIYYKAKVVEADGTEHIASAGPLDMTGSWGGKAGTAAGSRFLWGGDLFHSASAGGDAYVGMFMNAVFTSTGNWIGDACEVEGGC